MGSSDSQLRRHSSRRRDGRRDRAGAAAASGRRRLVASALLAAALAGLVLIVYWPALSSRFVNLDDDVYVSANSHVRAGLTAASVAWAWTSHYLGYQIPLTWMSLMLDADLFGANAGGFHLTNVLLHAANSALLFLFLARATGDRWRAALAAALWALHPLRVESVAWITERKDVLAGFFGLGALCAYAVYARAPSRLKLWAVVGLYSLALLSKPQLIAALPVILWLLDYWPFRRMRGARGAAAQEGAQAQHSAASLALEKWPLVVVTLLMAAAMAYSETRAGAFKGDIAVPMGARVANAFTSPLFLLGRMVWFKSLAPIYPLSPTWRLAPAVASGALLLAVSALVIARRRRWPWLMVGWFWFLAALAPGLTPPPGLLAVATADRFTYFGAIGISILLVWSIPAAAFRPGVARRVSVAAALVCVAALAVFARVQVGYWRDSRALFQHTVEVTGDNWLAEHQLASALDEAGDVPGALAHLNRCLELNPNYERGWANKALLLDQSDHPADAAAAARRAIALDPADAKAHTGLAMALFDLGRREPALAEYRKAIELAPDDALARQSYAWSLRHLDDRRP